MLVTILKETEAGEARTALTAESVKKLIGMKVGVSVESGAGLNAGITDADYEAVGAHISSAKEALVSKTDVLVCVNRPSAEVTSLLKPESIVIGFLKPLDEPDGLKPFIDRGVIAFSMEMIPRTTRAQSMDALSSMATIVGYKAVILAADRLPRMFPMLTTAAGTIPPAKVLVLGAGVAGLQAIATSRRLGAVVEGFDIRAAAGEAVRSLGAKFLEVNTSGLQTEDAGGYAKVVTDEIMNLSRDLIRDHAKISDCIITSAAVPGKRAPLLITEAAVAAMKRGSCIVDLAGATGGNCALSKPGENIDVDGVIIMCPLNLPATVPIHASQLYSRNITSFLSLMIKDGELNIDWNDDILLASCVASKQKSQSVLV